MRKHKCRGNDFAQVAGKVSVERCIYHWVLKDEEESAEGKGGPDVLGQQRVCSFDEFREGFSEVRS